MWSSRNELDIEKARDDASKLVLIGAAQKADVFVALSREMDIASLKRELQADERALFIVLEALHTLGYVNPVFKYGDYITTNYKLSTLPRKKARLLQR